MRQVNNLLSEKVKKAPVTPSSSTATKTPGQVGAESKSSSFEDAPSTTKSSSTSSSLVSLPPAEQGKKPLPRQDTPPLSSAAASSASKQPSLSEGDHTLSVGSLPDITASSEDSKTSSGKAYLSAHSSVETGQEEVPVMTSFDNPAGRASHVSVQDLGVSMHHTSLGMPLYHHQQHQHPPVDPNTVSGRETAKSFNPLEILNCKILIPRNISP